MGRRCGVGGEEEKWEEGERAIMFCLAPWAPYSVLLGALGPPLKSNLNWKLSESVSNYRLDLTGAFSDPCLYKYTHHPICTRTVQTTGQSVEWAHCLMNQSHEFFTLPTTRGRASPGRTDHMRKLRASTAGPAAGVSLDSPPAPGVRFRHESSGHVCPCRASSGASSWFV